MKRSNMQTAAAAACSSVLAALMHAGVLGGAQKAGIRKTGELSQSDTGVSFHCGLVPSVGDCGVEGWEWEDN